MAIQESEFLIQYKLNILLHLLKFLNFLGFKKKKNGFGGEWFLWETYPIGTGQRLTIDTQGAERRVRGQALVPLTGPVLRSGFHEVPFQLTDAGMMPEQVLLRLIKLLEGAESRGTDSAERGKGR